MIRYSPGIRDKLIAIFVIIKVLPLVVLAWFAWEAVFQLANTVENQATVMVAESREVVEQVGKLSTENSIIALNTKSRETIERLTTDTARALAAFLYDRDRDIMYASSLEPSAAAYRKYLDGKERPVIDHYPWVMDEAGEAWIPVETATVDGPMIFSNSRKQAAFWVPEMVTVKLLVFSSISMLPPCFSTTVRTRDRRRNENVLFPPFLVHRTGFCH